MYGLSNGEHIFDLTWPLKVKSQGQTPQKLRNTSIPIYNRYTHSNNLHKNSGWSLAGCIGCSNVLSAAAKLRRLALCGFICIMQDGGRHFTDGVDESRRRKADSTQETETNLTLYSKFDIVTAKTAE